MVVMLTLSKLHFTRYMSVAIMTTARETTTKFERNIQKMQRSEKNG